MTPTSHTRAAAREQAAHWLNLRFSGDMTPDDEVRFAAWLDEAEAHREAYQRVARAWAITSVMVDDPALAEPVPVSAPVPASPWQRWRMHGVAVAASLAMVLGISWLSFPTAFTGNDQSGWHDQAFRTGTGQRTRVTLSDGSVVTLDAETEMRLQDGASARRLNLLRGRAYFQVAHDPSRPFIVHAGDKQVRAIGTAFEVSFERGKLSVTLVEGKVRVQGDKASADTVTDMVPGRQLSVSADTNWALRKVDVEKATSWTSGRLIFMHDPLSSVVSEVNRYSTRKVVFKDGAIPANRIVGVFQAGDIDGFVKALELNGIAHRVSSTSSSVVMVGGPG